MAHEDKPDAVFYMMKEAAARRGKPWTNIDCQLWSAPLPEVVNYLRENSKVKDMMPQLREAGVEVTQEEVAKEQVAKRQKVAK